MAIAPPSKRVKIAPPLEHSFTSLDFFPEDDAKSDAKSTSGQELVQFVRPRSAPSRVVPHLKFGKLFCYVNK